MQRAQGQAKRGGGRFWAGSHSRSDVRIGSLRAAAGSRAKRARLAAFVEIVPGRDLASVLLGLVAGADVTAVEHMGLSAGSRARRFVLRPLHSQSSG